MKVFSSTQLFCCHDPMKFHGSLVFSSQYSDRGKKSQLHKISATIIINQILQGSWEARLMVSTLDKYGLSCLVWTAGLGHCVAFLTRHFYSYSAFLGGEYTFSRFPDLTYKFQLTSPLACRSSWFFWLLFQSTCFLSAGKQKLWHHRNRSPAWFRRRFFLGGWNKSPKKLAGLLSQATFPPNKILQSLTENENPPSTHNVDF